MFSCQRERANLCHMQKFAEIRIPSLRPCFLLSLALHPVSQLGSFIQPSLCQSMIKNNSPHGAWFHENDDWKRNIPEGDERRWPKHTRIRLPTLHPGRDWSVCWCWTKPYFFVNGHFLSRSAQQKKEKICHFSKFSPIFCGTCLSVAQCLSTMCWKQKMSNQHIMCHR